MNPLNFRALTRATHRLDSFSHIVKRHFSVMHHLPKRKKHTRFGGRRRRK